MNGKTKRDTRDACRLAGKQKWKVRGEGGALLPVCHETGGECKGDIERRAALAALDGQSQTAWEWFQAVQTQWNEGMNGVSGLNYPGAEACARLRGIETTPTIFMLLQSAEAEWLSVVNEIKKSRKGAK